MPLVQTRGAASAQGFGEFAQATAVNYIEDVFSCFLYTGNGAPGAYLTNTIVNNIDIAGKGGLVWLKSRTSTTYQDNMVYDTARGVNNWMMTNTVGQAYTVGTNLQAFNSNGFELGVSQRQNTDGVSYASWTFRKQPKFFDVVTYTGTGSNTTIAHSLGSVPGCIMVKRTDTAANWAVYHRSLANTQYLVLNSTAAAATGATWWNSTTPTSAVFSVGTDATVNASGGTYVAYIFAHDAGGFGLTGTDNVISCGSFNNSSGSVNVTLGYEPQWLLMKKAEATSDWFLVDNMRGMPVGSSDAYLTANTSDAENSSNIVEPTATGFTTVGLPGSTNFIYIAIRRGPMKVPTDATKVFAPVTYAGNSAPQAITSGFRVDMEIVGCRTGGQGWEQAFADRLRGNGRVLSSASTGAEVDWSADLTNEFQSNTGTNRKNAYLNYTSLNFVDWMFQRAPSFFDEVCFKGATSTFSVPHNLAVVPELIIIKKRINASGIGSNSWWVLSSLFSGGFISGGSTSRLFLNSDAEVGIGASNVLNSVPTSTTLSLLNTNFYETDSFVAYLFATCAGVSKVGSYTGTGATQTINCGFGAGGSRFVLIKRTDTTGDWYVWDSARGMVSGTDPSLLLNSTAAEVNANSVYAISTGFQIVSTAAGINASGGTYIFLAIA